MKWDKLKDIHLNKNQFLARTSLKYVHILIGWNSKGLPAYFHGNSILSITVP